MYPKGYGPTLRAVGWFLDVEQSRRFRIEENTAEFQVHWQTPDGSSATRTLGGESLTAFQRLAPRGRDHPRDTVQGAYAELLRTLGQELDRRAFTQVQILAAEGFRVHGQVDGVGQAAWYARDELRVLSERRRALREPSAPKRRWFPF
jgi:hypothetical protein